MPAARPGADPAIVEVLPTRVAPGSPPKLSKQELFDELNKNYREVVGLVRRVNEHLDKADGRSAKLEDLAQRMLDTTATLPQAVGSAIEQAQPAQVEVLKEIVRAHEDGTERIETSVAQLGIQMEVASQSHEQLVHTMSEFRETMHGVGQTNLRTADALDASIEQKRAADDRLAQMIVRNQWWMIGIVAGIMVFAASAFIVAVIALLQMGG